jgi:hypothetical protein
LILKGRISSDIGHEMDFVILIAIFFFFFFFAVQMSDLDDLAQSAGAGWAEG